MHGYSTDSSERKIVPLLLALLAIALARATLQILAATHLSVPRSIDAPSSMAFYGTLYAVFQQVSVAGKICPQVGAGGNPEPSFSTPQR
jgi:hypothetical protein